MTPRGLPLSQDWRSLHPAKRERTAMNRTMIAMLAAGLLAAPTAARPTCHVTVRKP
jgi:hypothetical protein